MKTQSISSVAISLGYSKNHATSESQTHHNSNLNANTMNINIANDANFKGATVKADDTLNLTVENNLNIESVRDSSTSASQNRSRNRNRHNNNNWDDNIFIFNNAISVC